MPSIGFRIFPSPPRPAPDVVESFRPIATSHLSDNMSRLYGAVGLRQYNRRGKLVGVAFTVKTMPGDNLMIHKGIDLASPGDVLVVDAGGDVTNAVIGELMGMHAHRRGIAGFVIDGAIRDSTWYDDFPCYARGHVHRGPHRDGPGEINVPVSIGGMVVMPGDIIVGDQDGVLAVRPADAAQLLDLARKKAKEEEQARAAIAAGTQDRSWIDRALTAKGVQGAPK